MKKIDFSRNFIGGLPPVHMYDPHTLPIKNIDMKTWVKVILALASIGVFSMVLGAKNRRSPKPVSFDTFH